MFILFVFEPNRIFVLLCGIILEFNNILLFGSSYKKFALPIIRLGTLTLFHIVLPNGKLKTVLLAPVAKKTFAPTTTSTKLFVVEVVNAVQITALPSALLYAAPFSPTVIKVKLPNTFATVTL